MHAGETLDATKEKPRHFSASVYFFSFTPLLRRERAARTLSRRIPAISNETPSRESVHQTSGRCFLLSFFFFFSSFSLRLLSIFRWNIWLDVNTD